MNPYNNIYSYSPSSNYQTNKISQYTSQNWNIKYYNNFSSQNQKNGISIIITIFLQNQKNDL